ncbi:hypothetical protein [uncultured Legionella sp.]|uniref:RCC1 domain-containing protein n=1 Tax=uncultured Legionella sp. TaxID=210934 RepID=UPI0026039937|nr:hypothetical protein [uncultured Legionella sp.]
MPISALQLSPGDSGTLLLTNTGQNTLSSLTIQWSFGWSAYFSNNCPAQLATQQSCSLNYTIPTPAAVGILNPLAIQATGADNSIKIPVSIQTMGAAKCWGSNRYGQLGSITNSGTFNPNNSPLNVQTLSSGVMAINGGQFHTCALSDTGTLKCWGINRYGQLGSVTNSETTNPNHTPLNVQTLSSGVVAITAGASHTCALLDNGSAQCWGLNRYGQLGFITNSGSPAPNNSPLNVQTLSALGIFNHNLGNYFCAIAPAP